MSTKPNIILLVADDHRGSALGCERMEPVRTPNLDALAARGVRCSRAYHHGSCHGAVCAPSRAMLHTGLPYEVLDPSLLGPMRTPDDAGTLPPMLGQKLGELGYDRFATGKWHNGVPAFQASFNDGKSIFFGGMADHWFTPVCDFDPTGRYADEKFRTADGHSTDVFGQATLDYIRSRADDDQPFFCYCAFTAPHDPRTPPDAHRQLYDPRAVDLPPNVVPEHPFDNGELACRDELLLGRPRNMDEIRRSTAAYFGMISHIDAWIGRIHEALAQTGQLENTIVVYAADHGLAVGQHGLLGKQNLYEHSVRVPLLLAGPGLPEGQVCERVCYQHDLHPTLLEMAGGSTAGVAFESLLPVIQGHADGREFVTARYRDLQRMACGSRYKLIEYTLNGEHHEQIFDLQRDPWETQPRTTGEAPADEIERLREQLAALPVSGA